MYGGTPRKKPKLSVEETFEMPSGGDSPPLSDNYLGGSSFIEDFNLMMPDSTVTDLYDGRADIISNVGMASPPRSPFVLPTAPSINTNTRALISEASDFGTGGGPSGASLTELVPYTPARGSAAAQATTPITPTVVSAQGTPVPEYISIQTPATDPSKTIEEEDDDDDDDDDDDVAEEEEEDDDEEGEEEEEEEASVEEPELSPPPSISPPPTPTPMTPPPASPSPSPPDSPIQIPIMTRSLRSRTINKPVTVSKKPTKSKAVTKPPVYPPIPWEVSLPSPVPSPLSSTSLSTESIISSLSSKQNDFGWSQKNPFELDSPIHANSSSIEVSPLKPEKRQLRTHKKEVAVAAVVEVEPAPKVEKRVSRLQAQKKEMIANMEKRVLSVHVPQKDIVDFNITPKSEKRSTRLRGLPAEVVEEEPTSKIEKLPPPADVPQKDIDDDIEHASPKRERREKRGKTSKKDAIIEVESSPVSNKRNLRTHTQQKDIVEEDLSPKSEKRVLRTHASQKPSVDKVSEIKTEKRALRAHTAQKDDAVVEIDEEVNINPKTEILSQRAPQKEIVDLDSSPKAHKKSKRVRESKKDLFDADFDSSPKARKKSKRVRDSRKDLFGTDIDSSPKPKEQSVREPSPEMELADIDSSPKPEKRSKRVRDSKKDIIALEIDSSPKGKELSETEYSPQKDISDIEITPKTEKKSKRGRSSKKDISDLDSSQKMKRSSKRSQSPQKNTTDPEFTPKIEKRSKRGQDSKKDMVLTQTSSVSPATRSKDTVEDGDSSSMSNALALIVPTRKGILDSEEAPPVPDKRLLAVHAYQDANPQMAPLRPGRPVRLILYCFMNHEYFELDLRDGQNVICIGGDNGTGKSALSIAITFVLGGNANSLGRTNKIEGLIKEGHEFAQVDIVLLNTGDSLSINEYGNYIRIRRIIDRKNCSRSKICKADVTKDPKHWKFRDLPKKELIFIKEMLGIMPENPLQILQQVEVINFKRISGRDLYKHFYEAVRITPCENILKKAREHIDVARDKQRAIEFEVQCKNRRIKEINAMLEIAEEIDTLEKQYKWALVTEAEDEKKAAETNLQTLEDSVKEVEKQRTEANEFLKSYVSNYKLEETNLKKLKEERKRKAQVYDQKMDELKDVDSEIKKTNSRIKNKEKEIKDLLKEVDDLQARRKDQHDREELRRKIKNDIVPKINLVSEKVKELQGLEHERKLNIDKCEQSEMSLKSRQHELKREIVDKQKEIDIAKKSNGRLNNNWPPQINNFVELVNSTPFKKKPRGPMCMYVTVKEKKWREVIEVALRSTLFHFTVDNIEDETTMKGIIEKVFGNGSKTKSGAPTIFRSTFFDTKHDISKFKTTGAEFPTIYDMIDIKDDPVVYNWVLDTTNVESSLLIEDAGVARRLMSVLRPEIQNCMGAYTSDFYFITPQPKYGSWAQNNKNITHYLKLSSDDTPSAQIRQLEKQKMRLEKEFAEVVDQHKGSVKNSRDAKQLYDRMNQTLKDKKKELNQLKYEQTQLYEKLGNLEPDAATQNDEIQNHLNEIQNMEADNKKWEEKIERKKEEVKDLNKELKILEEEKNVLDEKILTMEDARKSYTHEEGVHKQKLKEYTKTLEKLKPKIKSLEAEIKTAAASAEEKIKDAELLCKRIVTTRESVSIKNDIEARKAQKINCTDIEEEKKKLRLDLEALQDQVVDQNQSLFILNCLTDAVLSMIRQLDNCLNKTKGIYANHLSNAFQNYMSIFRAVGKIVISDTNKTLAMEVDIDGVSNPVDPLQSTKGIRAIARESRNNISSLSGGERTFSTFLFILAMWHVMECGFFIVDEIDLFLDAMNQQKCQEALFKYMKKTPEALFFHISPNPISSTIHLQPERIMFIELKKRLTDSDSNDLETPD